MWIVGASQATNFMNSSHRPQLSGAYIYQAHDENSSSITYVSVGYGRFRANV